MKLAIGPTCAVMGTLLLAVLAAPGCMNDQTAPGTRGLPAAVANAPDQLGAGAARMHLSADAWRDFMPGPGAPVGGSGLLVAARLASADSSALVEGLRISSVWAVYGGQAWSSAAVENRRDVPWQITGVVRGGPRWGPGVSVTLVAGVRVGDGPESFVRADAVPIARTD